MLDVTGLRDTLRHALVSLLPSVVGGDPLGTSWGLGAVAVLGGCCWWWLWNGGLGRGVVLVPGVAPGCWLWHWGDGDLGAHAGRSASGEPGVLVALGWWWWLWGGGGVEPGGVLVVALMLVALGWCWPRGVGGGPQVVVTLVLKLVLLHTVALECW